jgi:hypothetical protein
MSTGAKGFRQDDAAGVVEGKLFGLGKDKLG